MEATNMGTIRGMIKEDVLYFFGSCILDFQMNRLSLEQLKSMFNVFGYEVLSDIGYGSNYFLICDSSGQEYDIYVNDSLFEFLAIRGNDEALKCMNAILDWERDFGYPVHKNWINVAKKMCKYYGQRIDPRNPLGFRNGQFLFGFYYNIPNNVLPIFWGNVNGWVPLFERYFNDCDKLEETNSEKFF